MTIHLNLLPADLQRRAIRRRVARLWVTITVLLTAGVFGIAFLQWQHVRHMSNRATEQKPATEAVRQLLADIRLADQRIVGLEQELAGLSGIRVSVDPLAIINCLREAAAVCRDEFQFTALHIASDDDQPASSSHEPVASAGDAVLTAVATELATLPRRESTTVTITGLAASDLSIARLTGALREAAIFHAVTVENSGLASEGNSLSRSFQIKCVRLEDSP